MLPLSGFLACMASISKCDSTRLIVYNSFWVSSDSSYVVLSGISKRSSEQGEEKSSRGKLVTWGYDIKVVYWNHWTGFVWTCQCFHLPICWRPWFLCSGIIFSKDDWCSKDDWNNIGAIIQAKLARKKALEEMSKDLKEGFENMKFFKFYPIKSPKYPDISSMQVCLLLKFVHLCNKFVVW